MSEDKTTSVPMDTAQGKPTAAIHGVEVWRGDSFSDHVQMPTDGGRWITGSNNYAIVGVGVPDPYARLALVKGCLLFRGFLVGGYGFTLERVQEDPIAAWMLKEHVGEAYDEAADLTLVFFREDLSQHGEMEEMLVKQHVGDDLFEYLMDGDFDDYVSEEEDDDFSAIAHVPSEEARIGDPEDEDWDDDVEPEVPQGEDEDEAQAAEKAQHAAREARTAREFREAVARTSSRHSTSPLGLDATMGNNPKPFGGLVDSRGRPLFSGKD